MQGEDVSVLFVRPQDAKRWKTWLTQHGALHPDFRMHSVQDGRIAIPFLLATFMQCFETNEELEKIERGTCFCPYSSSVLGNPQTKHNATQKILHDFLQSLCADNNTEIDPTTIPTCPSQFELMGDDRTVVIPQSVWDPIDLTAWMQQTRHPEWTPPSNNQNIWDRLWQNLARLYSSRRVARRGYIDPDNRVRHSTFQVLWHDGSFAEPGWITITEQGIRQSFDLTQVMFSRGNITEKIRFGKELVQEGEDVLDLYAGIGYFTLPALIHGRARHVVACEWNPDAVRALSYNLQDNGVSDRATVLSGDCRTADWGERSFDRASLGLLPSSQGGWKTAVRALKPQTGGWLHIHGNVPVSEVEIWGKWLCVQLKSYAREASWSVVLAHIQKVKSFAPTVNHYVADVCLGPPEIVTQRCCRDEGMSLLPGVAMMLCQGVWVSVEEPVKVPSCALSETGVLHQAWMRELDD